MADALASEIARDNEKVNQKSGMALGRWAIWTLLASIAIDKDQLQGMIHTAQRLGSQPVKKLHSDTQSLFRHPLGLDLIENPAVPSVWVPGNMVGLALDDRARAR